MYVETVYLRTMPRELPYPGFRSLHMLPREVPWNHSSRSRRESPRHSFRNLLDGIWCVPGYDCRILCRLRLSTPRLCLSRLSLTSPCFTTCPFSDRLSFYPPCRRRRGRQHPGPSTHSLSGPPPDCRQIRLPRDGQARFGPDSSRVPNGPCTARRGCM